MNEIQPNVVVPATPPRVVPPVQSVPQTIPQQPVRYPVTPQPTQPVKKTNNTMTIGIIAIIVILFFALYAGVNFLFFTNTIEISSQQIEKKIHINRLVLKRGSYLVITKISGEQGQIPVTYSSFLDADTYENFDLPIYNEKTEPESGDTFKAVIYNDSNKDGGYDPTTDKPTRNLFGLTSTIRFKAL